MYIHGGVIHTSRRDWFVSCSLWVSEEGRNNSEIVADRSEWSRKDKGNRAGVSKEHTGYSA